MAPNAAPTPTAIRFNMPTSWDKRAMETRMLNLLALIFVSPRGVMTRVNQTRIGSSPYHHGKCKGENSVADTVKRLGTLATKDARPSICWYVRSQLRNLTTRNRLLEPRSDKTLHDIGQERDQSPCIFPLHTCCIPPIPKPEQG